MKSVVKITDYSTQKVETVATFSCPWAALAAINTNMAAIQALGAGYRYQIFVEHPDCGVICVYSMHKLIENTKWIFQSSSALN